MLASFSDSASEPNSELMPSNGEAKTVSAAAPALMSTDMYSAKPGMEAVAEAQSVDGK